MLHLNNSFDEYVVLVIHLINLNSFQQNVSKKIQDVSKISNEECQCLDVLGFTANVLKKQLLLRETVQNISLDESFYSNQNYLENMS